MNILFVLPFMPAPNATQAGHRLAFSTLKELSRQGPVTLMLILRADEQLTPEIFDYCPRERIKIRVVGRMAALTSWLKLAPTLYPRFITRFSAGAASYIEDLCKQENFDFARFEFSQTFVFAAAVRRANPSTLVELSVHDLQFQVVLRRPNIESLFCRWAYATERKLLKTANRIRTLSEKDKVLVQSLLDVAVPVSVSTPPVSPFVKAARDLRMAGSPEPNTLIFWGAMNRKENEDAILGFYRDVFIPLLARGKAYKLYIVGSSPGEKIRQLASDRVEVTGFLEDPSSMFARAAIGVIPLTMGAGIKLKTMELVEAGVPVLSTPVGAEGLSYAENVLMIRDFSEFGKTLDELYVEPTSYAAIDNPDKVGE